eukprot:3978177-Prymnesium_polylepis.1
MNDAAAANDIATIKALVAAGVPVEPEPHMVHGMQLPFLQTPLQAAAEKGHTEAIEALVKLGPDRGDQGAAGGRRIARDPGQ